MSDAATMNDLELTINRTFAASREKVFNAWLKPEKLAKFMRPCDGDDMDARVDNDPVEGGRFSIVMKAEDKREIPHAGTYIEISPYARLRFTWESPYSLDDSVVTIDLTEIDANTTALKLHQVKFRNEGARDGHIGGWNRILGQLELTVG